MSEQKSQPRVITVRQIMEIDAAIASLGGMDMLMSETAYILGRLGQYCASISKLVNKEREKLIIENRAELKSEATSPSKKQEITKMINTRIESILVIEESIHVPLLKLSDFTAKSDRSITYRHSDGSTTTREYKEGEQLVPQGFFTAFGSLIKDDKSIGQFELSESKSKIFKMLGMVEAKLSPKSSEEKEVRSKLEDKVATNVATDES